MTGAPPEPESIGGLAVVRAGDPDAAVAVVLVHGAMDRAASFSRVVRRLSALEVLAYDRRGYGRSRPTRDEVGMDGHATDLLDVAATARAPAVVLVGHSYGGLVALRAAEVAASGSGSPVLRAVGSFEAPMPWRREHGRSAGRDSIEIGRKEGPAAAAEHFSRAMVGDAVWARLSEGDRAARRSEGDALLDDLRSARTALDVPDPLHLHVAVHSARGELSRPRLRWAAGELADRFGTPLVEIPGARHGAHLTHPDHFAGWITSLVGGSRAP